MGMILGRFRKKNSTFDQLEKLDSQIKSIEDYGKSTELTQRKVAGRFMLISMLIYVITSIVYYLYFFPETIYERVIYIIPLITAPLVIYSVKKLLTWWYNRKLKKNLDKLSTLKEEKKKMLDSVMETETYKVAKEILEKFAPDEVVTRKSPNSKIVALQNTPELGLRYRGLGRGNPGASPAIQSVLKMGKPITSTPFKTFPVTSMVSQTPRPPMPRMVLPKNRSALEKLVDYLVGDGPSNRYALICKQCFSHNGMALREEFEYLSFHCCYCHTFNPAKKQRPPAPKLGVSRSSLMSRTVENTGPARNFDVDDSTSESEKNSQKSDSEEEIKNEGDDEIKNEEDKEEEKMDTEEISKKD